MTTHQAAHAITTMSRVLRVSSSGYSAWRRRGPSVRASDDARLTEQIRAIHTWSRGTYGAPRIQVELAARGRRVSRKRVARLMRRAGGRGVSRRKWGTTTIRDRARRPAPGSGPAGVHRDRPGRALGGRHHLRRDVERLPLPGRGARCLESSHRGLGHGDTSADRTSARGARDGGAAATTA